MSDEVKDANIDEFVQEGLNMRDTFSTKDQYKCYKIPKKSGGFRRIEAPNDELKTEQRKSLRRMQRAYRVYSSAAEAFEQYEEDIREALGESEMSKKEQDELVKSAKVKLRESLRKNEPILQICHFAHAFTRRRNIASGASPHVGANTVLTVDLKDFFPSVKWEFFDPDFEQPSDPAALKWKSKTYQKPISYCFGNKTTSEKNPFMIAYREYILPELKMHFCDFGDGKGLRLPQGAPGSPFISNVLLSRLDYRAAWRGYTEKVQYTRYADDLIFSGESPEAVKRVYARVVALLKQLGQNINPRKYTLKTGHQRKKVLGLVVNALPEDHPDKDRKKARMTRYKKRQLRAMQHHCRVLYRLYCLGKERGFKVPDYVPGFLLSKTEDMTFGEKMQKVAAELKVGMDELHSSKLSDPPRWYTKKIAGHAAFKHMIDNYDEKQFEDSISYCAVKDVLRKIG